MKFSATFTGTYLLPTSNLEEYESMPHGSCMVEVKFNRNPRFHRLAFAVMHAMFENQDQFEDFEAFRDALKIMTNSTTEVMVKKTGEIVHKLDSWSFADMDDEQFHRIYNKILSIASKRFGDAFVAQFEPI